MEEVATPESQNPGTISQSSTLRPLRGCSKSARQCLPVSKRLSGRILFALAVLIAAWLVAAPPRLHGREHKRKVAAKDYGLGFSTEIAAPESEVLQAVEDVVNDGIIQGSKEFNKNKYIENTSPATSSSLFPE